MKIIKTTSGEYKLSKKAWKEIGKKAGWLKEAQAIDKAIEEAVTEHLVLPSEVNSQAKLANYDLMHGPLSVGTDVDGEEYFGFEKATDLIKAWSYEIGDIYINHMTGGLSTSEPDDTEDAFDWVSVDRQQLLQILFGRELSSYL